MAHEGVPLVVIQRQLGHANLGITTVYLQGIDSSEIIRTVHARPSPTISATAGCGPRPNRRWRRWGEERLLGAVDLDESFGGLGGEHEPAAVSMVRGQPEGDRRM